jgi:outer membrane protein assembly factor BamC
MDLSQILRSFVLCILVIALGACSFDLGDTLDRRADYKSSQSGNPLAVPPDLTASTIDDALVVPELTPGGSASLSAYSSERTGSGRLDGRENVLQEPADITIERDGNRRWLVVQQSTDVLWPRIKKFWTDNGFSLEKDDPRIGIMETHWLENRADIPDGPIRNVLKRFLDFAYVAPTRDKFRVRLDRVGNNSEVYLTHYGVEEVFTGRDDDVKWQSRPRDPELEAEMLNRLMVSLGASERRAETESARGAGPQLGPRTRVVDTNDGYRALIITENYDRAWRLVGLALDGSNFIVEDQNREQGLYLVEQQAEESVQQPGLLGSLLFWRDSEPTPQGDRYQIRLSDRGDQTAVVIQDLNGQPADPEIAQQILLSIREVID